MAKRKELLLHHANQKSFDSGSKNKLENSRKEEQTLYRNNSHVVSAFEVLQSFRNDELLCDVKLETEDGTLVYGHKVVLASATPYFRAMFTSFEESKKNHVILQELDSTALKLLVDFIYTAQIIVTEDNVQVLLYAANLLQLNYVRDVCCDFLLAQLHPTNCLGIKDFVSLHGCVESLSSFKHYINFHFAEVIEGDEFLSLSFEQVVELISCDKLNVPSEEKIFECVISWVNHNFERRKDVLAKLMKYVRLPLASKEFLLNKVNEEPLLKNSYECKDYIIEALRFHLLKPTQSGTIPKTIRTKPRQSVGLSKVILIVGGMSPNACKRIELYDPTNNQWQPAGPEMNRTCCMGGIAVLENRHLFVLGGSSSTESPFTVENTVDMLDLSSPCWVRTFAMLRSRRNFGVGVLDNCIYAIGGRNGARSLKSAEVFYSNIEKWQLISEMSTGRYSFGVGIIFNHLYAVGGYDVSSQQYLKSVERYCPRLDLWTPVADMCVNRHGVGVGILNGLMYAVGGNDGPAVHNSVEVYRPSINVWTLVSCMHLRRKHAGVVAFDGLLYVMGGNDGVSDLASVEIYNPKYNTWSMLPAVMNISRSYFGAVVIEKPLDYNT